MLNYLEIVTTVSSVLLTKSGGEENLRKKEELWRYIQETNPKTYQVLRRSLLGVLLHIPGRLGRRVAVIGYTIARKIFGFN